MNEWLEAALRLAEEADRAISENGTETDIWWLQDKVRSIAWHIAGATGNPGPVRPVIRPENSTRRERSSRVCGND